ncbi:MAG: AAA family ATPase [Patescibacteria group bacterium]|nr:AAA family ATPase [Patescibacteria group bacterium]
MPENELVAQELLHVLLMGRPGGGKSTLCATFPKPMLVFGFDPPGKERAYMERGTASGIKKGDRCFYREVYDPPDPSKVIIRYEFWGENNPVKPTAYPRFVARMASLEHDITKYGYQTVVGDTATFFELSARTYSEYSINASVKDGRQHYAFSAKACEQYLMMRWPNLLLCHSIMCCHIDDQKDDSEEGDVVVRKMAALPGKLPNRISGGFGEVWRVYFAGKSTKGKPIHLLQTQPREANTYDCKSLLHIPDGIQPHYEAIQATLTKNKTQESV